ncbi:MAG: hypothetical protein L0Z50_39640 [Verrucomicrobiales bacterium]|nr:hypothetical protein [Verrucomicrobiales bacterium]
MITIAFYDTKPYDREFFEKTPGHERVDWRFHEFRLNAETAGTVRGAQAVCVFVNDRVDRACLEILAREKARLAALRSAGFNNVDVKAARELGLSVARVPAYSPHAVAEHVINTSRGKLIDTTALIAALKAGRLGGVALDVYEEEEDIFFEDHSGDVLQDDELSRLLTFPNVLITAHQAFLTREALGETARVTVQNLLALEAGKPFLDGTAVGQ